MGYYTLFDLQHKPTARCRLTDAQIVERISQLLAGVCGRELDDNDRAMIARGTFNYNSRYLFDERKWYDYSEDMIKLSRELPDVYLILEGTGEDTTDWWRAYYFNGVEHEFRAEIHDAEYCDAMERDIACVPGGEF